ALFGGGFGPGQRLRHFPDRLGEPVRFPHAAYIGFAIARAWNRAGGGRLIRQKLRKLLAPVSQSVQVQIVQPDIYPGCVCSDDLYTALVERKEQGHVLNGDLVRARGKPTQLIASIRGGGCLIGRLRLRVSRIDRRVWHGGALAGGGQNSSTDGAGIGAERHG